MITMYVIVTIIIINIATLLSHYKCGLGSNIGCIDRLYTNGSWLHFTDHCHTDWCPPSITVSTSRSLTTDFNTVTITISLNYTLQISHIKSSLHRRTFNWALLQLTGRSKPSPLQLLGTDNV
jgi:hypothetical protein